MDAADPRAADPRAADPRATETVGHLQAAATEMIAAARAFLDLLEDVVEDEETVAAAASVFGSFTRAAMKTTRSATEYGSAHDAEGAPGDPDDGVHHIRIS